MKKFVVMLLCCVFTAWVASGAFAVVFGAEGYENHGKSEADAWEIDSAETLDALREVFSSFASQISDDIKNGYYKMTSDIDFTEYTNWQGIGGTHSRITPFSGHFDGDGHTIKINIVSGDNLCGIAGLFRCIGDGGVVKNLSVRGNIELESIYDVNIRNFGVYVGG